MEITYKILSHKLKQPFTTNHRTITDNQQIIVFAHFNEITGVGTALLPYEIKTEIEDFIYDFEKFRVFLKNKTPYELESTIKMLSTFEQKSKLAFTAVDIALHDIFAKTLNQPLSNLLGLKGLSIPQSGFSISAPKNENEFLDNIEKYLHFPILKIKTTTNTNLRLIRQLRSIYSGRIWVDANCAWTLDQAIIAAKLFSDLGVEILEQPIPIGNYEGLKKIKNSSSVLLFADEDCTNELSLFKLQDCVDGVALKIHKSHGLSNIRKMLTLAKSMNLKIMLGCRTENSIGISAISQLAGLADYLDLDGSVDLLKDSYQGAEFSKGDIIIPEVPGIGVTYV